jgi:hypothetical protein
MTAEPSKLFINLFYREKSKRDSPACLDFDGRFHTDWNAAVAELLWEYPPKYYVKGNYFGTVVLNLATGNFYMDDLEEAAADLAEEQEAEERAERDHKRSLRPRL